MYKNSILKVLTSNPARELASECTVICIASGAAIGLAPAAVVVMICISIYDEIPDDSPLKKALAFPVRFVYLIKYKLGYGECPWKKVREKREQKIREKEWERFISG